MHLVVLGLADFALREALAQMKKDRKHWELHDDRRQLDGFSSRLVLQILIRYYLAAGGQPIAKIVFVVSSPRPLVLARHDRFSISVSRSNSQFPPTMTGRPAARHSGRPSFITTLTGSRRLISL
jgi:hypothetical protein